MRRRLARALALSLGWLLATNMAAVAEEAPYLTFTVTRGGDTRITQSAYLPVGLIDGADIPAPSSGTGAGAFFYEPEDIFVDSANRIYVADTGNARIVEFDPAGRYARTIGEGLLRRPTGVYVTADGNVYVADYDQEEVLRFGPDGRLVRRFGRPDSPLFGRNMPFKPRKVAVDHRGQLFVVGEGAVQGLIQLSPDGGFMGYFGGNWAAFSLVRYLQRRFYTREQLERLMRNLPPSVTNVTVDPDGLVYTSTYGLSSEGLKKLNIAGRNLLPALRTSDSVVDVTVGPGGEAYAIDARGRVWEYDAEGNLLFVFGGSDEGSQRLGLFRAPSGIAAGSDHTLYVLDGRRSLIHVLRPTEFADLVHEATALYLDGRYGESKGPWERVLRLNSLFDRAHTGIGMAEFRAGRHAEALVHFRLANDREQYSNPYWELRREWLMAHLANYLVGFAAVLVAWSGVKRAHRRRGFGRGAVRAWRACGSRPFVAQLLHVFRMLRRPLDGYWELSAQGKASVASATVLLGWLFVVRIFELYQTNFLFSGADPAQINLGAEALKVLVPVFAWVISNYLVSALHDGEGKLSDIYKGTIYALSPYLVFGIPLAVLSKGLTQLERVVYDFSRYGILLWCGLLLCMMVKEIHNYELDETARNVVMTLFGMLMMGVIAFILFGLSNQLLDFVYSVYQELRIRAG